MLYGNVTLEHLTLPLGADERGVNEDNGPYVASELTTRYGRGQPPIE